MHLAIVTPYPPRVAGKEQYGYHVSEALRRTRAFRQISVLTERASGAPLLDERPGFRIERVWHRDGLDVGVRIARRLRTLDADVIWYNLGAAAFGRSPLANVSGLLSPAFTHLLEIPSVVTMHELAERADFEALGAPDGPLTVLGAKLVTVLMLQADVTCVTLGHHADWLGERYPHHRLMHIPHGAFDPPQFLPNNDHLELLHFGSQAPFKGLDLLLTVFGKLRAERPRLRLTVAGAEHPRFPGYLASLRRQFSRLADVQWEGVVPDSELPDLFGRATIVVLPYTATTGSSSVLYRAATWGRPVVTSDLMEMKAAVDESGFRVVFFPAGDTDGLAEALRRLLDDPDLRSDQVQHNLDAVGEATLERTCQLYVRALNLALAAQDVESRVVPTRSMAREAAS